MGKYTFTFNGKDSNNYGVYAKELPIISPKREIDSIKVDGRNGYLHIDNGTYESYDLTIPCAVTDLTKINDIKGWLTGIGTIIFSNNPTIQYDCIVKNQIPFDRYLINLKEFPLQLEVNPIGKSTTQTTVTKTSGGTFIVGGTIASKPILEIKGTGEVTITLNGTSFTLSTASATAYIVDCDLMNVTKSSTQKNSEFTGNFPSLVIGSNSISWTGTVSEVKIKYYESYL